MGILEDENITHMPLYQSNESFFIIRAANRKEFKDIELLLLARSVPFSMESESFQQSFFVPLNYQSFVKSELEKFRKENRNWPPVIAIQKGLLFRFSLVHLGVVICLTLFHWRLDRIPNAGKWMENGMLAVEKVLAGEWYRTVTALTLHADGAHLLSNLCGLLVFVGGVHQFAGTGLSWLLVLVAGALGNFGTAVFFQTAHNAVGASTAVFGAVGLMGAFGVKRCLTQKPFRKRFFIPLIGALGLFAMLGTNPSSDVMSHIFGLLSGVVTGLLLIPVLGTRVVKNPLLQGIALLLFSAILISCWRVQLGLPPVWT